MRWILLISVIFLLSPYNQSKTVPEEKKVFLNCREQSLRSVIDDIRIQTGVNFIYQDDLVNNIKITCIIKGIPIEDVLKKILEGLNISYKKFGDSFQNGSTFVLFNERKPLKTSYKAIIINQKTADADTVISFENPKLISKNTPIYPVEAAKNNIEGKVKLKFLINKEGIIYKIIIQESSGSEILDSAAADYINNLKFIPAKTNGIPRSVWMSIVLRYMVVGME